MSHKQNDTITEDQAEQRRELIANNILSIIEKQKAEYTATYNLFLKVRKALEPFIGKSINKRLATAVGKALPGWVVYYEKAYGMYHLRIWGKNYEDRTSFLLGYDNEHIFSLEPIEGTTRGFDYFNECHALDNPRAKALETLKTKIPDMVQSHIQYIEAKEKIEEICEYHDYETFYKLQDFLFGKEN